MEHIVQHVECGPAWGQVNFKYLVVQSSYTLYYKHVKYHTSCNLWINHWEGNKKKEKKRKNIPEKEVL